MPEFSANLAVLVGIGGYSQGIPALQTPVPDATALAEVLRDRFGYEVWLRTDEQASREKLCDLLTKELPQRLAKREDTRLLFYFAGHGHAQEGEAYEGPVGYFFPHDARRNAESFLPMRKVFDALNGLPCRHFLAILDCCFAGAAFWDSSRDVVGPQLKIWEERYLNFLRHPAWQVLTSCAYNERALDVPDGRVIGDRDEKALHSPFAQALLDGLAGEADRYPDGGDGVITASELYAYLLTSLEAHQTPRFWPLRRHRQGEFVFRDPSRPLTLPRATEEIVLDEKANPYRGLEPYGRGHAGLFFGRDAEIERLETQARQSRLTVVVGASGSGKSSLVRAGLAPRLEPRPDGEWKVQPSMRPGADPFESLAKALANLGGPGAAALREEGSLRLWIESWLRQDSLRHLVLIVDQLEELLTQARAGAGDWNTAIPTESRRFLARLAEAVLSEGTDLDRFHLILTVRSDFEPVFLQGALAEPWRPARFSPRAMTPAELREVIEKPAAEKVLFFESRDLVDSLAQEVAQMPGALPLLSFTLSEMYRRYIHEGRGDRTLSEVDYQELGGVLGSLRKRAEEEVERLDEKGQEILRRILLRMVDNQTGELARRRVFLDELRFPGAEDNQQVRMILDRLLEARLITRGSASDPRTGREETYVEPAHDKLITAWDRLLAWTRDAGEDLALQRRVSQASADWAGAQRGKNLLWTDDPRLPVLHGEPGLRHAFRRLRHPFRKDEPRKPKPWLNQEELAFLDASHQAWQTSQIRLWGIVTFLLVATAGSAWFFYRQNQANLRLRLSGVVQRLAEQVPVSLDPGSPDHDSQRALLLARQAYNVNRQKPLNGDLVGKVDDALRRVLDRSMPSEVIYRTEPGFDAGPLAFSPAAPLLAAGMGARVVLVDIRPQGAAAAVLDPETSSRTRDIGATTALAFDRTGRLVTGHTLGYLCAWTLRSPRASSQAICQRPLQEKSEVLDVAFQPGTPVLVASLKSPQGAGRLQAWRWDGDQSRLLEDVATKVPVKRLAVRGDGAVFGVGEGSSALFRWRLGSLAAAPSELAGDEGVAVQALALRSSGKDLLGFTSQMRVLWWRADPPKGGAELPDLESAAALASDPSSDRFVVSDGTSLYWRGEGYFNLQLAKWMTGEDSGPTGLSEFISDKLRNHREEISSYCHDATSGLTLSPDGRFLAVSCDRSIRLWRRGGSGWLFADTPSRATLPSASQLQALFDPAPSGRLAVAQDGGSLGVWDLRQGRLQSLSGVTCRRAEAPSEAWLLASNLVPASIANLAWSERGLSAFETQGDLRTYRFTPSEPVCETESLGVKICAGALSHDGQWVAAVLNSPALAVMPRARPRERQTLKENGSSIEPCQGAVAFHPTQELLAGGYGTAVYSWSRDSRGAWQPQELAKLDQPVRCVAFSQNGKWLAAGGGTKRVSGYVWLQDRLQSKRSLPLQRVAQASVEKVGFSAQGDRLVVNDSSGRIYIWDLSHLERDPVLLPEKEQLSEPSLSADGIHLAALAESGGKGVLRVWNLDTTTLAKAACDTAASNLSWEDWTRFVGAGEPYERTCPKLPVHPSVLEEGNQRVLTGDVAGARKLFERVSEIEPKRGLDPERRIEALQLRERLLANLRPDATHLRAALQLFPSAEAGIRQQGIDPIRFQDTVNLCRWGAILADPQLALPACDDAIGLLQGDAEAHEGRAIARALLGDLRGAAADLSYAVSRPGREVWAQELRQGRNPFRRPEVIRELSLGLSRSVRGD